MGNIYLDVKSGSTSSSSLTKIITFTLPASQKTRLIELSISPDSSFSTTGSFKVVIDGVEQSQTSAQSLPSSLTIPFWKLQDKNNEFVSNTKVEIWAVSDGSTTVTATAVIFGEGI